jgi:uncharacterized phage protein (TIGR01671 family)
MRTIKFRQFYHGKMMFFGFMDEGHTHNSFISPVHCCNKKYPAMQFTGLQDSKGVDIYEGDLIKNKSGRICEVVFNKYCAAFDSKIRSDGSLDSEAYSGRSILWRSHVTVIGNIHQNPELLEAIK